MRSFKKIILQVLGIVLILTAANLVMNYALVPYSYVRVMMHQIAVEEYDTIFLGTSHGLNGISPNVVEEHTGRNCMNLCMGGEYPRDAYYFLKQVCKKSVPKRVVYELDAGYWCTQEGQRGDFNRIYYEMPWSFVKLEYTAAKMLELDFRATLFPWFYYRGQMGKVKEIIACKQSEDYKKYGIAAFQSPAQGYRDWFMQNTPVFQTKPEEKLELWTEENKNEDSFRYFEKLAGFCRDKDIELVVIVTPVPEKTLEKHQKKYQELDTYFSSYLEEQGVVFINYNLPERKIKNFDYSLEAFSDYEGHMNADQAAMFSVQLAEDLNQI